MDTFGAGNYIFPLCGSNLVTGINKYAMTQVYGTVFYLANDIFMTAGHVVENALGNKHDFVTLGRVDEPQSVFLFYPVKEFEIIQDYDIGIIKAEVPEPKAFTWDFNELPLLAEVRTVGFPHGYDPETNFLTMRALQGHVVSATRSRRFSANPRCMSYPSRVQEVYRAARCW